MNEGAIELNGQKYKYRSSPSMFMDRNNPRGVKNDIVVRKQISFFQAQKIGGSKDPDETWWSMVGIIAEESGEVIRDYGMPPDALEAAERFRSDLLTIKEGI